MAHNHWPVGPEPQLRLTSVCYSWCQSDGRGCPTRSGEWGHAYHYGSGAHAEYSTGTAIYIDSSSTFVAVPPLPGSGGAARSMVVNHGPYTPATTRHANP